MPNKTLNLSTWQRAWLAVLVGGLRDCPARDFRHAAHVLDKMELADDEKKSIDWRTGPNGDAAWVDQGKRWDVELDGNDLAWLSKFLEGRDLSGDTRQIADLLDRLGVPVMEG